MPPTLMVKVVDTVVCGRVVTTRAPAPPVPVTEQAVPVLSAPPAPSAVIVTTAAAGTVKVCEAPVKVKVCDGSVRCVRTGTAPTGAAVAGGAVAASSAIPDSSALPTDTTPARRSPRRPPEPTGSDATTAPPGGASPARALLDTATGH
ncbi:hypothetical protein ACFV84_24725 [Kitasatospora sp. NPDC059811]|uniref:hypothetical protein n=1 Tax=Streptomycetaceae TaxID=2062 RepID=UPI001331BB91|nr:hypothetical protein [Streptomyces sp. MJM8645]